MFEELFFFIFILWIYLNIPINLVLHPEITIVSFSVLSGTDLEPCQSPFIWELATTISPVLESHPRL